MQHQQHQQQQQQAHQQQQQQLQQLQQQQLQQHQRHLAGLTNDRSTPNAQITTAHHQQRSVQQGQQQQQQQQQDPSGRLNIIPEVSGGGSHVPYKVQRVLIENIMVPCINMKAYIYTELLMTLPDLNEYFFPGISLENCKRVLSVLGVELYKGNRYAIILISIYITFYSRIFSPIFFFFLPYYK